MDEGPVVYQCVLDEDIAWHCGTEGAYYSDCRNSNSIGIEVRPHKLSTKTMYASDKDWYFDKETINNLVEFTKSLMKKYNIPADHVIRHYDVTHKWCPRPYYGSDVNSYYGVSGDEMWRQFKLRIAEKEEDTVNQEQFEEMYKTMIAKTKGDDPSSYAKKSCEKAKEAKVFSGDGNGNYNWQDPLTREAAACILDRLS